MLERLAESFCRKIVRIKDSCTNEPYLTRYFLFGSTYSRYALMLHHIHKSDLDRHLHDHPWNFWALILSGGYWEVTPAGRYAHFYRPWEILHRPATWRHRLILQKPAWTLVFRTQRCRDWGFQTERGWVDYRNYDFKAGCE